MNKRNQQNRVDQAHANKERPARIPMTAGNKLHVPESLKREGYQQYWQVDRKGAIEQMEAAWWEKVKNEKGDLVTVPAGNGEILYLMEIEKKYYDEDIQKQQDLNISTTNEQAQKLGESEYVPLGRNAVVQKEREII